MKNLEITCCLKSALVDYPPYFDSLLGWIVGIENNSYCSKSTKLEDIVELPIPIKKEYFNIETGQDWFYKCSNPIYKIENEWVERRAKRTDTHKIINKVTKHPVSISTAKGLYKQHYAALNCKDIQLIKYFVVGDKTEIERILKKIIAVGNKRSYGYGFVAFWEINEIEHDYSICYDLGKNGKMLMKTIPVEYLKQIKDLAIQNLRKDWGRYKLPYWHPDKHEVIVPC